MSAKKSESRIGDRQPVISFQTVGRQKLRTAVWQGDGDKRAILFFNGIGANLELIAPLAHALPDRDIITFDLPGIGKSPSPVIPYRPWWVAYAANTILKRLGYDKVDVIGVSWGGGAAQQFAIQHRGRVNRLILAATTSGMTMVPGNIDALAAMTTPQRYTDPNFLKENFQRLYSEDPGPSSCREYLGTDDARLFLSADGNVGLDEPPLPAVPEHADADHDGRQGQHCAADQRASPAILHTERKAAYRGRRRAFVHRLAPQASPQ